MVVWQVVHLFYELRVITDSPEEGIDVRLEARVVHQDWGGMIELEIFHKLTVPTFISVQLTLLTVAHGKTSKKASPLLPYRLVP